MRDGRICNFDFINAQMEHGKLEDMPSITNADHDGRYLRLDGEDGNVVNGTFDLTTTGGAVFGTVEIRPNTHKYKFLDGSNNLGFQCLDAAMLFRLYTQLGDGTQANLIDIYGFGAPASNTNRERVEIGWAAGRTQYIIQSEANGTGTHRPLAIEVEGYTNQLLLNVDGSVSFSGGDVLIFSDTGLPKLSLKQADTDEPFIKFIGIAASEDKTRSIVDNDDVVDATLTGWVKIEIQDDGNQVGDGDYHVPFYVLSP